MKKITLSIFGLTIMSSFGTVVIVGNGQGPTATDEVVNAAGTLVAGFGAVGTLTEAGITGATTTWAGLNFETWGLASGGVTTSTSGQFSFSGTLNPVGTNFSGDNIYLAIGFGGSSLANSTELFIYKFNTTFGTADSGTPINLVLGNGNIGTTLLGTEVSTPETAVGRFRSTAITAVPEPSAAFLGALGALGLLRRRRN
jgi:MYXO-CTERM domain-containing protein